MIALKALQVLIANPDWLTTGEIAHGCVARPKYAWEALKHLELEGLVERRGDHSGFEWRSLVGLLVCSDPNCEQCAA